MKSFFVALLAMASFSASAQDLFASVNGVGGLTVLTDDTAGCAGEAHYVYFTDKTGQTRSSGCWVSDAPWVVIQVNGQYTRLQARKFYQVR